MNEIIPKFNDSLIVDSADIAGDYLELGIDSILENDTLKELPIIKTFMSVGKIANNIRERNLLKNLANFISELNSGNIDVNILKKHQEMLKENPKKAEKELGRILIILDTVIENKKAVLLAKLYKSYINVEINWEKFSEYSEIIVRLFVQDICILADIYNNKVDDTYEADDMYKIERLNSLGLISLSANAIFKNSKGDMMTEFPIEINNYGKLFCQIILS